MTALGRRAGGGFATRGARGHRRPASAGPTGRVVQGPPLPPSPPPSYPVPRGGRVNRRDVACTCGARSGGPLPVRARAVALVVFARGGGGDAGAGRFHPVPGGGRRPDRGAGG